MARARRSILCYLAASKLFQIIGERPKIFAYIMGDEERPARERLDINGI